MKESIDDEWDLADPADEEQIATPAKSRGMKPTAARGGSAAERTRKGEGQKSSSQNSGLVIGLSAGGGLMVVALLTWLLWAATPPNNAVTEAEKEAVAQRQNNAKQLGERTLDLSRTWLNGESNEDVSAILKKLEEAHTEMTSSGLAESESESVSVVATIENVKSCSTLQQQLNELVEQFWLSVSLKDLDLLQQQLEPIQSSSFRRLRPASQELQEALILAKDDKKAAATLAVISDDQFAKLAFDQEPRRDAALRTLAEFYARSRNLPQEIDRRAAEKHQQRESLREDHWNTSRLAPYDLSSATQYAELQDPRVDGAAVLVRNLHALPIRVVAAPGTTDKQLLELSRTGFLKDHQTDTLSVVIPLQLGQQLVQAIATIDTVSGEQKVTGVKALPLLGAVCAKHKINKLFALASHPPRAKEQLLSASSARATFQFAVVGRFIRDDVQVADAGSVRGTIMASRVLLIGLSLAQKVESQSVDEFCRPCLVVSDDAAFSSAVCEFPETEGLRNIVNQLDTAGLCPLLPAPVSLQSDRSMLQSSRYAATLLAGSKSEIENANDTLRTQLSRIVFSPNRARTEIANVVTQNAGVPQKPKGKEADFKRAVTAMSVGHPFQACVELNRFLTSKGDRFDSFAKILYLNERCAVVRKLFPEAFQAFQTWMNSEVVIPVMTEDGPALLSGREALSLITKIAELAGVEKNGKEEIARIASLRKEVLDWVPIAYRPPDPPMPSRPTARKSGWRESFYYDRINDLLVRRLEYDPGYTPSNQRMACYERDMAWYRQRVAEIQAQWLQDQVQVVEAWPRRKELMLTLLEEVTVSRGVLRGRLSKARFSLTHHVESQTKPLDTWSGSADKNTELDNAEPVPVFLIEDVSTPSNTRAKSQGKEKPVTITIPMK